MSAARTPEESGQKAPPSRNSSPKRTERLTDSQKLASVLELLQEYRLTVGEFLKLYCTDDMQGHPRGTTQTRTKRMWNWLFLDDRLGLNRVLLDCGGELGDLHLVPLSRKLTGELEGLLSNRLGGFSIEKPVQELQLGAMKGWVQQVAPCLWGFLLGLVNQRSSHEVRSTDFSSRLLAICAILCFARAPRKGSLLQAVLGIYFYSMGVKRRVISLLYGLGISVSYRELRGYFNDLQPICTKRLTDVAMAWRHMLTVVWDNFDFNEGVRHETTTRKRQHLATTTGKIILNPTLPEDGLKQAMYNRSVRLTMGHLIKSQLHKDIKKQCQRYWIAESFAYSYPEVRKLFADVEDGDPLSWPDMPTVDRLPSKKYTHLAFGPILENEGTTEGTYNVVDNIFGNYNDRDEFCKGQLGFNADCFEDGSLYLINGDQKTVGLLQSLQREQSGDDITGRSHLRWFLPVPGLFHFRMNYMEMIHDIYGGADILVESLNHSKVHLGARKGNLSPFHHKEEVSIKAFFARITAAFQSHLDLKAYNTADEAVDAFLNSGSEWRRGEQNLNRVRRKFFEIVDRIREDVFTYSARDDTIDEVFRNHVRFLQDMEVYLTLKFAIKFADIGVIQGVIIRSCMLFAGSGRTNYANLCLYMSHLLVSGAATPELRRAFLSSMLVNCRGEEDSWFETDRLNEHHNLLLRLLISGRKRTSADAIALFTKVSLTASYTLDIREVVEQLLGENTNSRHTALDAASDVRKLAATIGSSMYKHTKGRRSDFRSYDIHAIGIAKLNGGVKVSEKEKDGLSSKPKKPSSRSMGSSRLEVPGETSLAQGRKRVEEKRYSPMIASFNERNTSYAIVEDDYIEETSLSSTLASQLLDYSSMNTPLDTMLFQPSQPDS